MSSKEIFLKNKDLQGLLEFREGMLFTAKNIHATTRPYEQVNGDDYILFREVTNEPSAEEVFERVIKVLERVQYNSAAIYLITKYDEILKGGEK